MKKKRIGGVLAAAVLSGLCTGRAFCLDMESYAGLLDKERMSGEPEYMVSGDQECRRLLMELVSAGAGKEREEFFYHRGGLRAGDPGDRPDVPGRH